jgi:hypothetical protein
MQSWLHDRSSNEWSASENSGGRLQTGLAVGSGMCCESLQAKNWCCVVTGHGNMLGPGHSMKTGANANPIGTAVRSLQGKNADLRLASCTSLPSFGFLFWTRYEGFACLP